MRVLIEVRNDSGAFVRHPRGEVFILKRPSPPKESNEVGDRTLTIDIGCEATLKDYRQPPEDASEIKLGTETFPHEIIQRLATRAGFLASLTGSINQNPINYPVFDLDGNFVSLMGALAFANTRVLYLDNDGRIQIQEIDLDDPGSAEFIYVTGHNEQFFDPLPGTERPAETVKVTSTTQEVNDDCPGNDEVLTFNPKTSSVTEYKRCRTARPRTCQTYKVERGQALPDIYPGDAGLFTRSITISDRFYEQAGDEKLVRSLQTKQEPRAVLFPEQFGPGATFTSFPTRLIDSEEVEVIYSYDRDVIQQTETVTRRPAGLVNPSLLDTAGNDVLVFTRLIDETRVIEEWDEVGDRWYKTTTEINYSEAGGGGSAPNAPSGSQTANQPPATERKEADFSENTKNLEGEAKFSTGPGSAFDERVREFQVKPGTATSDEQLDQVAKIIGQTLEGRDFGWEFGVALTDQWLAIAYKPLIVMDWQHKTKRRRYLANALSFVINQEESVVGGELIEIGTLVAIASEANPYRLTSGTSIDMVFDPVTGLNSAGLDQATVNLIFDGLSNGLGGSGVEGFVSPSYLTGVRVGGSAIASGGIIVTDGTATNPQTVTVESLAFVSSGASTNAEPPVTVESHVLVSGGIATSFDFDWIVVDANGEIVTSDGNVVTTGDDVNAIANEIVVDSNGQIVTSNGNVVATGSSANWDSIVVDSNGEVVTSNGNVVTST
ncbi:MAG: hypothetical protein F6K65_27800 [Moorea sp. SIO3C2]|nr:hypothetical protein [Moorena sp. SIO3C2]